MFEPANIIGWLIVLGALYTFYQPFRRMTNGWIVKVADKVRDDADIPPADQPDTEIIEDVAFATYAEEYPNDPRIKKGWWALPEDIRKEYLVRTIKGLQEGGADDSNGKNSPN